jgi:hypothetical protein
MDPVPRAFAGRRFMAPLAISGAALAGGLVGVSTPLYLLSQPAIETAMTPTVTSKARPVTGLTILNKAPFTSFHY